MKGADKQADRIGTLERNEASARRSPIHAINVPRNASYTIMDLGDKAGRLHTAAPINAIELGTDALQFQISTAFILISTPPLV